MIGRNAAVAEVGEQRHELEGVIALDARVCVQALLQTTMQARLEAFVEWAWDYFGRPTSDAILDEPEQANIDWSDDDERPAA